MRLPNRQHSVIIITHSQPPRVGIRWLTPGIKVYYVPMLPIARNATLPNFLAFLPAYRRIMWAERPDIIHSHAALSSMAHEAIFHARLFPWNPRTVFTDHSLFGFADSGAILTNKLLQFACADVDGAICVSHAARENTALRSEIKPTKVAVIPNAIVCSDFKPPTLEEEAERRKLNPNSRIRAVVLTRLTSRKGATLLLAIIPRLCTKYPSLDFVIGGDGPSYVAFQQLRDQFRLQDRVTLLGHIPAGHQRSVFMMGDFFINPSLTESFGICILEAASSGLFFVCTDVGGAKEVLPHDLSYIEYCKPTDTDLIRGIEIAIAKIPGRTLDMKILQADQIKGMYSWNDIAERTEVVYNNILKEPEAIMWTRLERFKETGPIAGIILCVIMLTGELWYHFLELVYPLRRTKPSKSVIMNSDGMIQSIRRDAARVF